MFTLTEKHLRLLCNQNSFEIPDEGMILFGLRGCLPVNDNTHEFSSEHLLYITNINYRNPRCTFIQWFPERNEFAVFPGSTAPNLKYIGKSVEKGGVGANQMMTGYYKDYRKGKHKPGSLTSHDAFRQTQGRPIRRTADDFDYDTDDRVEFTNPNDNLHAGWCQSVESEKFASAGCQVIVGYPQCAKYPGRPDVGPWKVFKENAYSLDQKSFPYVLLNGRDALKIALLKNGSITGRLRFGSTGDVVKDLQNSLWAKEFYEGNADGDFGRRTLKALLEYQESVFGPSEDDGIVGPNTFKSLDLEYPEITS